MTTKQKQFEEHCRLGNLEEIKKIVKDEDFLKEASLDYNYSTGVYQAADYNKLEVIKYLLEDCELKSHLSIHFENNCILKTAARQGYFEILNYLVLEYQMKLTTDIFLPNYDNVTYVTDLFVKRSLNNNLKRTLTDKAEDERPKTKKLKI